MYICLLNSEAHSQRGLTQATVQCAVALGLLLGLVVGVDSTSAQLGIAGFLRFDGQPDSQAGSTLATGDFNGDGYDDLAVGWPNVTINSRNQAGGVIVSFGGLGGWSQFSSLADANLDRDGEAGARFGSALTVGDFDNDGYDDLVIGIPGRTVSGADAAGDIAVIYGSSESFDFDRTQFFSQVPLPGAPEEDDRFGSSLAAGDLSADGVDDLAIGVHLEDIQGSLGLREDVGAVNVMYGFSGVGLTTTNSLLINEDSPGVGLNANAGERFGFSLAIGQFTHNTISDLAVGAPSEAVFGVGMQGAVIVFPGMPGGLDTVVGEELILSQHADGILGTPEDGDEFGYALAKGNFDGDLWIDLAIGVPGESELGTTESGAVQVLYGGAIGLTTNGDQFFVESSFDIDVDPFDRLGMALAAGDFDGDDHDDLAIGAPLDNSLGVANAGEVDVLYGTSNGLSITGGQVFDMIFFDSLEIGDLFGAALAVGRFFSQSYESQDLVVGVPRRGTPVGSEPGASLVIRSQSIFSDGFETGDASDWSNSTP